MIYKNDCTLTTECLERLTEQGLDGLPGLIRVMVNEAMRIEREDYLGAKPNECSEDRQGYTNGYKPNAVKTRVGKVTFDIPLRNFIKFQPVIIILPPQKKIRVKALNTNPQRSIMNWV